ncbi:hypothetical protein [Methylobacterium aquaticum]|uniref:hypothetical protein n=1 Tax=Methylobacterium aquaticum TaxID=270351 RepID=UPI0019332FD5|nr:hypothetical protein [Methylobacterium aquaticum]QRE74229.1 hypothetical protein F1D61_11965 [Methylobacterium aquaticum]
MTLRTGVFVLQGTDTLVPMQPEQFAAEVDFQALLSKFPALLVGDQIDTDNPRRFLLVKQELPIGHEDAASRWSLDHLFLDQDGVPTLVEVKRQSDGRLRREVVGQMLDYASNFQSSWNADRILSAFEATCAAAKAESGAVLAEFLGPDIAADRFWADVDKNIAAGKLRLLFVADDIPSELRRIVEFMNKQMQPAEVLAIELRQFTGQGLRTIVPMVFGQTQEAAGRKEPTRGERWTEERLLAECNSRFSAVEAAAARAILDGMKGLGLPLVFGTGRTSGSVYPLLRAKGATINPAYLSTEGKGSVWLQLKHLETRPFLNTVEERREIVRLFAQVENSGLTDAVAEGWGTIALARIAADPRGTEKVIDALQWIADRVKAAG